MKKRERERRKPIHQQLVLVIYTWHVWILFIYWSLFIDNRTIFKVQEQKKSIRIKWLGNWLDEKPFLAKREQMRKTWNKRRANEGETTTWSDFLFHFRLLFFTILFTNTPTHTQTTNLIQYMTSFKAPTKSTRATLEKQEKLPIIVLMTYPCRSYI